MDHKQGIDFDQYYSQQNSSKHKSNVSLQKRRETSLQAKDSIPEITLSQQDNSPDRVTYIERASIDIGDLPLKQESRQFESLKVGSKNTFLLTP